MAMSEADKKVKIGGKVERAATGGDSLEPGPPAPACQGSSSALAAGAYQPDFSLTAAALALRRFQRAKARKARAASPATTAAAMIPPTAPVESELDEAALLELPAVAPPVEAALDEEEAAASADDEAGDSSTTAQ